jgi:hypothetical protein
MELMREVDTASDDMSSHEHILNELKSFEQFRDRYPHLAPTEMSKGQYEQLLDTARIILHMSRSMAEETSPERYLGIRQHEARLTARLFSIIATPEVHAQPAFDEQFMPAFTNVTIAANFFDSFRDITKDHKRGIAATEPSMKLRARLLGLTAIGIKDNYRAFLHPRIWAPYARLITDGIYSHHKKNQRRRRERGG